MATLRFQWAASPNATLLLSRWQVIAEQVEPNPFLSLSWVSAWVKSYGLPSWLVEIYHQTQLVGIAFFNQLHHQRPLFINSNTMHLNHAGHPEQDQIWPEYNQLLALPNFQQQIADEWLAQLFEQHPDINEIDTGLCSSHYLASLNTKAYITESVLSLSSFKYDQRLSTFSELASKGLKAEIKRTEKELQKTNNAAVEFVTTPEQCWPMFNEMSAMHIDSWGSTSGFNNPSFMTFHQNLIHQTNSDLQPMIANIKGSGGITCRHYLLKCGDVVYFYLGVTNKNLGARVKAGTYLHAETIASLSELSANQYDFLGGEFRYKKRMSNVEIPMAQYRIKRRQPRFLVESQLKRMKEKLIGQVK